MLPTPKGGGFSVHRSTRDTGVPAVCLAGAGAGLRRPRQRAVQLNANAPNLRQIEQAAVQCGASAILRVSETVVAIAALKARGAWLLALLDASEEGLISPPHPQDVILQD